LEVYDINTNQLTGAAFLGTVGLDWQYAGIAPVAPGKTSDCGVSDLDAATRAKKRFFVMCITSRALPAH
jgi:hypothetical protein